MAARFKTFTAGAVLTASEVNTYLAKQAVISCDSSADYPSSPVEGMVVYDVALDAYLGYTTATTGWRPLWNMPWGHVASATGTATTNIGTNDVDINGMTVTWTAVQNRRYRVSAQLTVNAPSPGTNDCNVFVRISDASNVLQTEAAQTASLVNSFSPDRKSVV